MIFRYLTLFVVIWLAVPALAQTVTIRSGEHETFSRLTMTLPSRVGWTIEETNDGAQVVFAREGLTFDTSAVFDRIPRTRLADIAWQERERRLTLNFNCNCEMAGFWHDRTMLVLDIHDTPTATDRVTSARREVASAAEKRRESAPGMVLPERAASRAARMLRASLDGDSSLRPEEATEPPILSEPGRVIARQDVRERLLRQIGRAASQGLLSPQTSLPERRPKPAEAADQRKDVQDSFATKADRKPMQTDRPATDQINLKAQTSMDHDFLGSGLAQAQNLADSGCLPTARIDVASWGTNGPFGVQVSALRRRLTGEFDEPDSAIVEQLVRVYLYFGFGAEAADLLLLLRESHADRAVLSQLAQIAEQGWAAPGSILNGQLDCESSAALWSALSYQRLPADQQIDTNAILRAFSALPPHLRAYYGPILARRFLDSGLEDVSTNLLRILDRPGASDSPEAEMARAYSDLATGDPEAAERKLESVLQRNAEPSPEALIQLINSRVARGQDVSYEAAQLAGAYAYEMQNDAIGPTMAAAHIRALAASGAFDQAFENFARLSIDAIPQAGADLRSELFGMLARNADEVTFLRHAFFDSADPQAHLNPRDGNAVARRLLELGFHDRAADIVQTGAQASRASTREQQLIRAEIALRSDRPRQAIVELLNLTGKDANALRAKASSAVGDHGAAYHLFAALNEPEAAAREAWLEGDWQRAASMGDDVYQSLARLKTGEDAEDQPVSDPVLAHNQALLLDSIETRDTLTALLAANALPNMAAPTP